MLIGPIIKLFLLIGTLVVFYLFGKVLFPKKTDLGLDEDLNPVTAEEIEKAFVAYGRNANSIIFLYQSLKFFRCARPIHLGAHLPTPLVGYVALKNQNIVLADPLCQAENLRSVILEFTRFTQDQEKECLLFAVSPRTAQVASEIGFGTVQIGKEPVFNLAEYNPEAHDPKILSSVRQVLKKGMTVSEFHATDVQNDSLFAAELGATLKEWFDSRKADKMQLVSEVSPFKRTDHKRLFVARIGNRVEAFLSCSAMPGNNSYFIHDLIRRPTALNGVSEAVILHALKIFKDEGRNFASLGIASLAGLDEEGVNKSHPILNRVLKSVFRKHKTFMNFKALYQFKKKFNPSFEEKAYLSFYPGEFKFGFILAIGTLFSPRGILGDILHKWRRWSEGDQLPKPLHKFLSPDIAVLARPNPFTFVEVAKRIRFTLLIFFLNSYTFMNANSRYTEIYPRVLQEYGFTFSNFLSNKWYILVTSNFLHFNFEHLLGNLTMLLLFGGTLELIGGTRLAAMSYIFSLNANLVAGAVLIPILKVLDLEAWEKMISLIDVGASLGVMGVLGTLVHFSKYKKVALSVVLIGTCIQAIIANSYFALDHAFAVLLGYGIGHLYLHRRFRQPAFRKLYNPFDPSSFHNKKTPISDHSHSQTSA